MKRYVCKLVGFCGITLLLVASIMIVRVSLWQEAVKEMFHLRPSTHVLCLGNSHTGCTWSDSKELGVQVLWKSSVPIAFSVLRLKELERLGQLDGGAIRVCVCDCDMTTVEATNETIYEREICKQFPFCWRYLWDFKPCIIGAIVDSLVLSNDYVIQDDLPADRKIWADLSILERRKQIDKMYGVPVTLDGQWCDKILKEVREAHAICTRHGIELCLIAAPLVADNPQQMSPEIELLKEKVKEIGVAYYDFRRKCDDGDFRDAQHMTADGRRKFTEQMILQLIGKK